MGSKHSKSGDDTYMEEELSQGEEQQHEYIGRYLNVRAKHGGVIALRNNAAKAAAENKYIGAAQVLDYVTIDDPSGETLGTNIVIVKMFPGGSDDVSSQYDSGLITTGDTFGTFSFLKNLGDIQPKTVQTIDVNLGDDTVTDMLTTAVKNLNVDETEWANIFLVNAYTPAYQYLNFALLQWMLENVQIVRGGVEPAIVQGYDPVGRPTPILEIPISALGQETDRLACEATREMLAGKGQCNSCSVSGTSSDDVSGIDNNIQKFNFQLEAALNSSTTPFTQFTLACPTVVTTGALITEADKFCRKIGILVKAKAPGDTGSNGTFYMVAEDLAYYAMAAMVSIASGYSKDLTWAHVEGTKGVSMITPNLIQIPAVYAAANPEFMAHVTGWSAEKQLLLNSTFNCQEVEIGVIKNLAASLFNKGYQFTSKEGVGIASDSQARTLSWQSSLEESNLISQAAD